MILSHRRHAGSEACQCRLRPGRPGTVAVADDAAVTVLPIQVTVVTGRARVTSPGIRMRLLRSAGIALGY